MQHNGYNVDPKRNWKERGGKTSWDPEIYVGYANYQARGKNT
jgi:hypothetical protein